MCGTLTRHLQTVEALKVPVLSKQIKWTCDLHWWIARPPFSNYNRNRANMERSIDAIEAIELPNFPLFDALMLLSLTFPLEYPLFLHASLKHTLWDFLAHKPKYNQAERESLWMLFWVLNLWWFGERPGSHRLAIYENKSRACYEKKCFLGRNWEFEYSFAFVPTIAEEMTDEHWESVSLNPQYRRVWMAAVTTTAEQHETQAWNLGLWFSKSNPSSIKSLALVLLLSWSWRPWWSLSYSMFAHFGESSTSGHLIISHPGIQVVFLRTGTNPKLADEYRHGNM